ncbi:uncharacterized protein LOC135613658 isoform X2 [Musa acuminata AAA Group]|uniref:uncharacterized protein LOC135613658 isoform X2 n=1 Tax=Musa acuminata AAA Group TaxID=214697 RepID=UPI0031CF9C27
MGAIEQSKQAAVERHGRGNGVFGGNELASRCEPKPCLVKKPKDTMNRRHIPAFGKWDYSDDLPITQYFESAVQAGLVPGQFLGEDSHLFKVPPVAPEKPAHHQQQQQRKKGEKQHRNGQERKQAGEECDTTARRLRAPKAVDEDLYKIPPELLCRKPKRKKLLRSLWSGCLGLNCIA